MEYRGGWYSYFLCGVLSGKGARRAGAIERVENLYAFFFACYHAPTSGGLK
ncbi:hypothetical protein TPADAL_0818 [Treponema pallidum subsp. pallidum DAL-1]|uniref:Uncharacterized protein TP_0818 n=4 Tax=Treponema pallidum TaxID=160 RepID=Y818_TREPA|nr:RecName: Full=Uncharacterized protein TP_0818 [Treponema pallidum subsp. pallidum str. Nichols]ACD71235.1 hypothetical protein TPASS_0818 [Treponema pallidum subsp. pallidum SS14]AEZ57949.1 hypothetical protein TPESAMD_0818 [Treponema pallidum subsp. pertenue str. SamoaD]AEZ59018.1 hypothetical protein TPECDC2_0818 [Treponema pallidum subsp. pertenue str. CDC2]AEZ60086.1 hypothetical protein TPEGAU_0818 [Treponema pallidum subsp. pertenue str. Gauthier]AEZ61146.1 hypothetical protein TPADAL